MFCGINSAEINEYEINGCAGGYVISVTHWVDEFVPKLLAYKESSKGLVTCLQYRERHFEVDPVPDVILPSGGKREC